MRAYRIWHIYTSGQLHMKLMRDNFCWNFREVPCEAASLQITPSNDLWNLWSLSPSFVRKSALSIMITQISF